MGPPTSVARGGTPRYTGIHDLPSRPKLFVGREDIVEKVTSTLVASSHVALIGAGGIGKSLIAIVVLRERSIASKFKQHRYFIQYDNISPSTLTFKAFLDRIISTLGVITNDRADRRDAVLRHLRNIKSDTLLVLDSAETFLDSTHDLKSISNFVVELGDMTTVSLMFTSRSIKLHSLVNCHIVDVPALGGIAAREAHMRNTGSINWSPKISEKASKRHAIDHDESEPIEGKICWIAAEDALQHAKSKISSVSECLHRWGIPESDYVTLAGFDESLIQYGIGYLEQIHVFISAEVDATSPLLFELGKIFSPFPSILFTKSAFHHMPVFKDDGTIWEFDELVYFTASKFADGGSSSEASLRVISFSRGSGEARKLAGLSQGGSSSESGDKNDGRKSKKGNKQNGRDEEEDADKDNESDQLPDDDPDEPSGDEGGTTAESKRIVFNIVSELYPVHNHQHPFQFLTLKGDLTIQTTPEAQRPPRFSTRRIQFAEMKFGTQPATGIDAVYKQFYVRVTFDSQQTTAGILTIQPRGTPASDRDEKQLSSMKISQTRTKTAGFGAGTSVQGTGAFSAARTKEENAGNEKKRYTSGITQRDKYGVIEWGFDVDDERERSNGIHMGDDILPTACFEFIGASTSPTPAPPERMSIEISSYWSRILATPQAASRESGHSPWLSNYKEIFGNFQAGSYSNLCQIVALETVPLNLPKRSDYQATVYVSRVQGTDYLSNYAEVRIPTDDSVKVTTKVTPDNSRMPNAWKLELPTHKKLKISDIILQKYHGFFGENKSH